MILANHGIISSSGTSYDADALAFITAASITNNTHKTAINTLVTDLKTYNIWTKMKAIYPFVGGSATSHKYNLKDPRDLDAAFRLVFSGGWTHSSTGALPNGTNAGADTKLVPSSVLTNNNTHLSFYSRTQNTSLNGIDIGCYDFTTELGMTQYYNGNSSKTITMYEYPANAAYVNNTNTLGFQIGSRTSSTSLKLYFNNSLLNTNTTNNVKTQPTISLSIGASTRPVGFNQYSNRESAFASIGDGLTDTEATNLYTAVQLFNTTLNRNV